MEKINPDQTRQWVAKQTAYLDPPPGWQPDADAALARFRARRRMDRPRALWPLWLACAAVVMLVAAVAAQQLWQNLTVQQVAFVRVNPWPDGVPSPKINLIGIPIPPIPARDISEAGSRVHYEPRLPRSGVLSGSPRLSTTFSLAAGTIVKTADLVLALRKTGVTDEAVPPQWEGAQLVLHTSGIVLAQWPDVVLVQSRPLTLTAPPGFDFSAYSALILRVLGVAPEDAQRLAREVGTVPPWLAPIDRGFEASATIEPVTLNSGPGTLLEQISTNGTPNHITIVWSVPDRVFLLNGTLSRELAMALANAVP
jgi:hypothetical protein